MLSMIGPTYHSFFYQTLSLIKIQDSTPRQVKDTPQELFLTHDINALIASLPGFNGIMRQAQSNDNQIAALNNTNQSLIPLINFHKDQVSSTNVHHLQHRTPLQKLLGIGF